MSKDRNWAFLGDVLIPTLLFAIPGSGSMAMFCGFVVLLFAWGLYDGVQHSFLGAVYPVGICVTMLPIAIYPFHVTAKNKTENVANHDYKIEGDHAGREGVPTLG